MLRLASPAIQVMVVWAGLRVNSAVRYSIEAEKVERNQMVAKTENKSDAKTVLTACKESRGVAESDDSQSQLDKFKEAARQLGTDDDEERFEKKLKKLVKQKPHDKGEK
jgi:hypothetical protein